MLKVTNVKVYDLIESVIASGYAMLTEPLVNPLTTYKETGAEFRKGLKRMTMLVNSSKNSDVKCHHHALCGIRVSFDVIYPQYWTPEFQRYNFADIVTSSSKMHRLCKMDIRKACNKFVDDRAIKLLEEKVHNYNEEQTYENFMEMISNCPMGLELFMRVSTNYLELQTIYFQRRNHRLKDDWGAFCEFIENLPYFRELILGINE